MDKKPDFKGIEARRQMSWEEDNTYAFKPEGREIFSIDTPPPTVSGKLHMGHVYSYCHADFLARFWRMNGRAVFYPMGYDDNGLPTEHLVERELGQQAHDMGMDEFGRQCLAIGEQSSGEYEALWRRLGLSIDWSLSYRTIGARAQRLAQWSFIDLYEKGYIYRREAPVLWCTRCQTAIAQAELEERQRASVFCELLFRGKAGDTLPIATTRPELLPACAAVFVHPDDERYQRWIGQSVEVPLMGRTVPILADRAAEPEKGTGAVMCCTFGDAADVNWWRAHDLPLIAAVGRDGRMGEEAGAYTGLTIAAAREQITADLECAGLLQKKWQTAQIIRVHDRCEAPVEYVQTPQFFVRLLDYKDELLEAGMRIEWKPAHMVNKYRQWLENLSWDWCISRQRSFGVPFPVWHCGACGQMHLAKLDELPVDPRKSLAARMCPCGAPLEGETDVMDTWATSSLSPQLATRWGEADSIANEILPTMSMRPLAHEIIRTWAFYSIVKAQYHWRQVPWQTLVVSGWGLAPEGSGKISKSKGGGPSSPAVMIERFSADALRYWAAGTGLGKDAIISSERMAAAQKMLVKLWNTVRFAQPFLAGYTPPESMPALTLADAWILARLQRLIGESTRRWRVGDYATARSLVEVFFWTEWSDNYLEMAKKRLYEGGNTGAHYALYCALDAVLKMLMPFIPHMAEQLHEILFAEGVTSLHCSGWPAVDERFVSPQAEERGRLLCALLGGVRRYKSESGLSLGSTLARIQIVDVGNLMGADADIASSTRAQNIEWVAALDATLHEVEVENDLGLRVAVSAVESGAAML